MSSTVLAVKVISRSNDSPGLSVLGSVGFWVIVNCDAGADFAHVVSVLDEVRKLGIVKVGINTDER